MDVLLGKSPFFPSREVKRVPAKRQQLQAAALTTILWLAVSSLLQYWHRLSPLANAIINGFTGCVWIGAFSLLSYRMGSLTVRGCSTEVWGTDQGVLVCQLYKLLFSAAVVAMYVS